MVVLCAGVRPCAAQGLSLAPGLRSWATHVLAAPGTSSSGTAIPGLGSLAKGCPGQALPCPGGPSSSTEFAGHAVKWEVVIRLLRDWPSRRQGFWSRAERWLTILSLWSPVLGDACANHTGLRV